MVVVMVAMGMMVVETVMVTIRSQFHAAAAKSATPADATKPRISDP